MFRQLLKIFLLISILGGMTCPLWAGDPFKEATFTQVINDVRVIETQTKTGRVAAVNTSVLAPEVVQTGPQSRCELKFADQTVTRVGANTSFSMEPTTRGINLQSGSVLFHSPTGKGGGRIQTAAATAAVTGTTIIVSATSNGGFKVMVLEGHCNVRMQAGRSFDLKAGQLTFILPGQTQPSPPIEFLLDEAITNALLVQGFSSTLDSWDKLELSINQQEDDILNGKVEITNALIGDAKTFDTYETYYIDPAILADVQPKRPKLTQGWQEILAALQGNGDITIANTSDFNTNLVDPKFLALQKALQVNGTTPLLSSGQYLVSGIFGNNINITANSLDMSLAPNTESLAFVATKTLTLPSSLAPVNTPPDIHFVANTISFNPTNSDSGTYTLPNGTSVEFAANYLDNSQINNTTFNYGNASMAFNLYGSNLITMNGLTFTNTGTDADLSINALGGSLTLGNNYFFCEGNAASAVYNDPIHTYLYSNGTLTSYNNDFYDSGTGTYYLNTYSTGDTVSGGTGSYQDDFFLYGGSGSLTANFTAGGKLTFTNDYFLGGGTGSVSLTATAGQDLYFESDSFSGGSGSHITINANAGRDLYFENGTITPDLNLNASTGGVGDVTLNANRTLTSDNSNYFQGGSGTYTLNTSSGADTQSSDDTFLSYGSGTLDMTSTATGKLSFTSDNFLGDSYTGGTGTLNLTATATQDLTFTSSGFYPGSAGVISINAKSTSGNVVFSDTSFNPNSYGTMTLTANAGNNINIDWPTTSPAFNVKTVNLTAVNTINFNQSQYSTLNIPNSSNMRMSADTINIYGVNFASGVTANFYTGTGSWNTSGGIPHQLNLVNTTYGSISNPIAGSGGVGQIGSTSLYSYKR